MSEYFEHFAYLVGFKVVGFRFERDEHGNDEGWPIYTMQDEDGCCCDLVLSRDTEGNGGGFAFIEPTDHKPKEE